MMTMFSTKGKKNVSKRSLQEFPCVHDSLRMKESHIDFSVNRD
jgi:hypothetical protein